MLLSTKYKPNRAVLYFIAILLGIAGVFLSAALKEWLRAPNYGLGVVIVVTAVCYLYGIRPALITLTISILGVVYLLMEPVGSLVVTSWSDWARLITLVITLLVTCFLVLMLRAVERKLRRQNELIEEQNEQLQAQNEELQVQNEEIQAQTEEIQVQSEELEAQNEELLSASEELRATQEQLVQALQHETRIAQTLQQAFLPRLPDRIEGLALAADYTAGSNEAEIGGDFYDIFPLPDGRLAIAIGDASGKGLHAARQAVTAKYGLRSISCEYDSPAKCIDRLNDFLCKDPDFIGFITIFFGIVDLEQKMLTYCSAGHLPPLLYRGSTGEILEFTPTGRLAGVAPEGRYEEKTVTLLPGDRLIMYTDGITEARGEDQELFGCERLSGLLANEPIDGELSDILTKIITTVKSYAGGQLTDDAAAVLMYVVEED